MSSTVVDVSHKSQNEPSAVPALKYTGGPSEVGRAETTTYTVESEVMVTS